MSSYNQNNLLIPLVIVLGNNGGTAKTSELIAILDSVLLPNGEDLVPYRGRRDSKFSQTVRNALAPERSPQLITEGYAIVNGEEGENKYVLTKRGWQIYKNLLSVKIKQEDYKTISPLQQIFYGAPGTGKSHKIKENELVKNAEEKKLVFRTTFHPDSDYSTFVGAYKPTMKKQYRYDGKVKAKYYEDDDLADAKKDDIIIDKVIQYDFVPQTFTNAYVAAWKNQDEKVFLIIEEINRGNCAQIFGDLFQLLDRDENGVSEYKIKADADIRTYLEDVLGKDSDGIKDGELCLPNNLYIWATMNTSDQSLFPIDSAFKRRWDWKYVKIKNEHKDWKVDIDIKTKDSAGNETTAKLDWYEFIDKINEIIASMTSSADKQLGYFFCKPKAKDSKIIDAETFVSKVIFYLWNDVFKDYAFEDASLFQYTTEVNGNKETKDLTFPDFYNDDESINIIRLTDFIEKVMNWKKENEDKE